MPLHRPSRRSFAGLLLSLAAGGITTTPVHAATVNRTLFTWTGRVDRELYLTMRGTEVRVSGMDARLPGRPRVTSALPRSRGDVFLRLANGRGDVDVIEQPSARNGYLTTIRIRDPRGGSDTYRLTVYWQGDDRYDSRDNRRDDRWGDRDDERWGDRRDPRADRSGDYNWDPRGNPRNDDDRYRSGDNGRSRSETGFLRWSGRVDDVVELRITGRRVDAIARSGQPLRDVSSNLRGNGLPARAVTVRTETQVGRGSVDVVQQPAAWNNYTAIIRIHDPRGGASLYDLNIYW